MSGPRPVNSNAKTPRFTSLRLKPVTGGVVASSWIYPSVRTPKLNTPLPQVQGRRCQCRPAHQ
jgi:hypothetical protein